MFSDSICVGELLGEKIQVKHADEEGFNQTYTRMCVEEFRSTHELQQKMANCGQWVYVGESPFNDQLGKPYIWSQHGEWKIALVGESSSRYSCCQLPLCFQSGEPEPRPWKRHRTQGEASVVVQPLDAPRPPLRTLEPVPDLDAGALQQLYEKGYVVVKADRGMSDVINDAVRLSNILIYRLADTALGAAGNSANWDMPLLRSEEGTTNILVRLDKAPALLKLLARVAPLAEQLFQEPAEVPKVCQLAIVAPEGDTTDTTWKDMVDKNARYHIDGRGKLPNGFGLLMGIALSEKPDGAASWGAFACHPGSHRNSALQKQYKSQLKGKISAMDLGHATPVVLRPGDILIAHPLLAHRRTQNWSAYPRMQVYFRLRPRSAAMGNGSWQANVLEDPFSIWPGLRHGVASSSHQPEAGESPPAVVPAGQPAGARGS
ncbi:Rab35 [Symbiodinium natans]|uniref:Rab35 protein n=1 Tax=Symbiodinium natans TaxID=878477 RepID=A0A812L7F2_9DINO|nr:Rab35 [Symbiodinium natans]